MRTTGPANDLLARLLEAGLAAVLVIAPLPFGSVGATARLGLEIGAGVLAAGWLGRSFFRPTRFPPIGSVIGAAGLLLLALFQALPIGEPLVRQLSPSSAEVLAKAVPPAEILEIEARISGAVPTTLDSVNSISLDPAATASALRTGLALLALFLVACCTAAVRGVSGLAIALLTSAGFQGLYGLIVLGSGHEMIWHLPKRAYLDSATGTFVNRNHFACLLAMALACGAALIMDRIRKNRGTGVSGSPAWVRWFSRDGSRTLMLGLLLLIGVSGLLVSFSRAGIALGLLAVVATISLAGRSSPGRARLILIFLLIAVALLPLVRLGADRLVDRYAQTQNSLTSAEGRGRVWLDSARITATFPVFGAGFGTFATVYPQFRSPEVRQFYAHAHNDLIQAFAEGGFLGGLLVLVFLWPIVRVALAALRGTHGTLGIGFAAATLAFLLHGLVDFNSHIPANAATAAILAGSLVGLPWKNRN